MSEKVREYWDARAATSKGGAAATTDDVWLRELEITTIAAVLDRIAPDAGSLLDVGCGDGHSTLRIAEEVVRLQVRGLDFSPAMIVVARAKLQSRATLGPRASFDVGDVTDLDASCGEQAYDLVLTDRCLINLESPERQTLAVDQIARRVKPGGHYIAIENFVEGQANMNAGRRALGLPEIPVRWHNLFFTEKAFSTAAQQHFHIVEWLDFASSYYFATRLVYSKMCQMRGEAPDYGHELHRLAVGLPWAGQFSPIRMVVLRRFDQ